MVEETSRIQLDFSPESMKRLEEIKAKAGVTTNAQAFSNSLRIYEWYLNIRAEGCAVLLKRDGVLVELEFRF